MNDNELDLTEALNAVPRTVKSVEYKFCGVEVVGEATLLLRDDCVATDDMRPYFIPADKVTTGEQLMQAVKDGANTSRFDCQRIIKIAVTIFPMYEAPGERPCTMFHPIVDNLEIELD